MATLSRRRLLRVALLGPAATAIAACGADRTTRTSSSPGTSVSPDASDVRSFGAVGDGKTDDTAALERALASLRTGQSLVLPAGHVFSHARVLAVRAQGVTLTGGGTLSASAEGTSSLQLLADDVHVTGLTLAVPVTTHRWSAPDQHRLFLGPHTTGIAVRDVTVTGSAAAGVFSYGAQHFVLDRVRVADTRADGIHLTNGSAFGQVSSPQVMRSGDDGVAVVSYEQDGMPCHDIAVTSPVIRTTTGGRGLSVVGGHDVAYRDIYVDRSSAASVYLACEGNPYNTFPTQRVAVTGGTITGANTDAGIDHGAVLVYSGRGGGDIGDVLVSGLRISGTRDTASRQIGVVQDSGGQVGSVTFRDLTLADQPTPYEGNVATATIHLQHVRAGDAAVLASQHA